MSSEALRRLGRGELTPEQYAKAVAWVNEKWTIDRCPFHGETNWYVGKELVESRSSGPLASLSGATIYPSIVVVCAQCGYTVFLNAIIAGVISAIGGTDAPQQADERRIPPAVKR